MKNSLVKFGLFSIAAVILVFSFLPAAGAHETREVAGKYKIVAGFLNEPAFSGEMNAAEFTVSEFTGRNETPVMNLENSFTAKVLTEDGKEMELKLRRVWSRPGTYAGYFFPTRAGKYVFQLNGTLGNLEINERFESGTGPNHFDSVQNSDSLKFPDRIKNEITEVVEQEEKGSKRAFWIGLAGIIVGLAALMVAGASIVFRTTSSKV